MSPLLNEEQRTDISILQYLSMLYVPNDPVRSRVSSRQTAQALGLHSYDVEDIYERLVGHRFVETNTVGHATPPTLLPIMDARLDPARWDRNRSPLSALYAHYVTNAPSSLRSKHSQNAVFPSRGCYPMPNRRPPAFSTVVATDFNGVYNPYQVQTPMQPLPPVETCLLISSSVERDQLTSENLVSLAIFRILLRGLYSFGKNGLSLAEWLDRGPAKQTPPLYCLCETDDTLAVAPAPDFNCNVAVGGLEKGPYSAAPYVLTASDGSTTYTVTPAPSGVGTIERGGTTVSFTTLGRAINGTWVLQLAGRLP
jgi:hypothetical protein